MFSIYKIKPKFQQLLQPVLQLLHKWKITANQITLASIFLSAGIGILFWHADKYRIFFLALPVGLFIRMALNALDGMMAQRFKNYRTFQFVFKIRQTCQNTREYRRRNHGTSYQSIPAVKKFDTS